MYAMSLIIGLSVFATMLTAEAALQNVASSTASTNTLTQASPSISVSNTNTLSKCSFEGKEYNNGEVVEVSGNKYMCDRNHWVRVAVA